MIDPNDPTCPWDCPVCGPFPDPPQFISDDQDKRIGWICCMGGEEYDQADDEKPARTRYRSIDDD